MIVHTDYVYVYIYRSENHCDTLNVLSDLRNIAYWTVINKTLNETAKGNFKNTLIQ